jgi:HD superfamily phosphohydrolase
MMFRHLVANADLAEELTENDVELICKLIQGGPVEEDRKWLYEIVSNSRNGIDVDKFDYLIRDTQKINVHYLSFNS